MQHSFRGAAREPVHRCMSSERTDLCPCQWNDNDNKRGIAPIYGWRGVKSYT
jgi:hypothetical protein